MLIFANFLLPTWIVKLLPLSVINFESAIFSPLILIPPPLINLIASEVLDTRSIFLSNWGIFTPSGSIIDNECSSISNIEPDGVNIPQLLKKIDLVSSTSEAIRLIKGGGIKINGEK